MEKKDKVEERWCFQRCRAVIYPDTLFFNGNGNSVNFDHSRKTTVRSNLITQVEENCIQIKVNSRYLDIKPGTSAEIQPMKLFDTNRHEVFQKFILLIISGGRRGSPSLLAGLACLLKTYLHNKSPAIAVTSLKIKKQTMFNSISWFHYFLFVMFLLCLYYLFVGIKFYSVELRALFKSKTPIAESSVLRKPEGKIQGKADVLHNDQAELFPTHNKYAPQVEEQDNTFELVEELATRLKEVIADASFKKLSKDEFTTSLRTLLRNYQILKRPPFIVAINNLIASECDKYNFIHLTAEERVMIWDHQ